MDGEPNSNPVMGALAIATGWRARLLAMKQWIALALGGLVLLVSVYFAGRRTRRGQVDAEVAQRQTATTQKQIDALQTKVNANAHHIVVIEQAQSTEEAERDRIAKQVEALSDSAVVAELRERGLLK